MTPKKEIQIHLEYIEKLYDVEILLAAECSSRSWGYASSKSDFDVFFVYKSSKEHYLDLFSMKDSLTFSTVLKDQTSITFTGWDLSKALKLSAKSNPALLELVGVSNTLGYYKCDDVLHTFLDDFQSIHYSDKVLVHSYISTAKHHLYHDYDRHYADDYMRKAQKAALAGFRSLMIVEDILRSKHQFNPLFLYDSFEAEKSNWNPSSNILYDHKNLKEVDLDDLDKFYEYLCNKEKLLTEKVKSMDKPSLDDNMYKVLNRFFVDCLEK